jgi:hypothetical protein
MGGATAATVTIGPWQKLGGVLNSTGFQVGVLTGALTLFTYGIIATIERMKMIQEHAGTPPSNEPVAFPRFAAQYRGLDDKAKGELAEREIQQGRAKEMGEMQHQAAISEKQQEMEQVDKSIRWTMYANPRYWGTNAYSDDSFDASKKREEEGTQRKQTGMSVLSELDAKAPVRPPVQRESITSGLGESWGRIQQAVLNQINPQKTEAERQIDLLKIIADNTGQKPPATPAAPGAPPAGPARHGP